MQKVFRWLIAAVQRGLKTPSVALLLALASPAYAASPVLWLTSDAVNVSFNLQYSDTPKYFRVYLDTDRNAASGYPTGGTGAEYLIEQNMLYRYTGSGGSWSWAYVKTINYANANRLAQWNLALADIGTPAAFNAAGQVQAPLLTSAVVSYKQSSNPVLSISGDASNINFSLLYSSTPGFFRTYIDTDRNAATGYPTGGVGAEYLIEQNMLYRYTGSGGSWSWAYVKTINYTNANKLAQWNLALADIGKPAALHAVGQVEAPLLNSTMVRYFPPSSTTPLPEPAPPAAGYQVTYSSSAASFPNPERGFYHFPGSCDTDPFDKATLQGYRTNENISLVMCVFYLRNFTQSAISQTALSFFQSQMDVVRASGMKTVVRFAYTDAMSGVDATPAQVAAHLDQLAPYLANNADVIAVVQAGFIGAWGEWYYTTNYGNEGVLSATDWANRKALTDKLLQVLPEQRAVQLRTPNYKRTLYGANALTAGEAFSGSARARLGHHNDCFLAAYNDGGTYIDKSVEYPYLATETMYLPMGGETCETNRPRTDCATALQELQQFHWSFLNIDYYPTVVADWKTGGCFGEITQKLGYRFSLTSGIFSGSAKPGGSFSVSLNVQNSGWAAPFNARGADIVLRNTATGALYRFALDSDPRTWLPGQTAINRSFTLPTTIPSGNYTVLLHLPDPVAALRDRPEYAIQLANTNVWESATGFNNLQHVMAVAP